MMHQSGILVVNPKATIAEALEGMVQADTGSILVTEGEEVLGIVTERDVLKHWKSIATPNFLKQPITKMMSAPVFCLLSHEVHKAAMVMLERKIRHIPILGSHKKLIGIMSIRDVLRNYDLYSKPKVTTPELNPIAPNDTGKKTTLSVLNPTLGLEKMLEDLFGQHFEFKVWSDTAEFLNSPQFRNLRDLPLFIDLDATPKPQWETMLKGILANLSVRQPRLFMFLSPQSYNESEVEILKQISQKVHWHVYARPVSIAALINDLAELRLPKK